MLIVQEEGRGQHGTCTVGAGPAASSRSPGPVPRGPSGEMVKPSPKNGDARPIGSLASASASSASAAASKAIEEQPAESLPMELEAGAARTETIHLAAGEKTARRYILDGCERLTWECFVADGYTVDVGAKVSVPRGRSEVSLSGRRLNLVDTCSRVVSERERHSKFHGCLDLGGEHAGCLPAPGERKDGEAHAGAVLTLNIDNSFSFFTSKDVWLRVTKSAPQGPMVLLHCPASDLRGADSAAPACAPVGTNSLYF
eukprot:TRINITY_DN11062_c0_g1_i1.p1 TRINITY_DN11062_c0_g1~~TRINITY_DN11062_c0_g1_i1.p1  ORF type:complete len:257 (-),score=43.00 TRINITY_DN11062_c0_g1_i1:1263-2033(-)